jgi:phage gp16-like protein
MYFSQVQRVFIVEHYLYFTVYDIALGQHCEMKTKCKSDNETKISCKVMTLDEKIKILDKLGGGVSAAAVGLTFR